MFFHPDRMADRILGMGDVMTLVEKATEEIDEKEARRAANKMMAGTFGLDDMLSQLKQVQKTWFIRRSFKIDSWFAKNHS